MSNRLTQHDRNSFISAVLNDVPMIDYDEQAREKVQKFALTLLPEGVSAALKAFPDWFMVTMYISLPGTLNNCSVTAKDRNEFDKQLKANKKLWAELVAMEKAKNAQGTIRSNLREKVRGLAYSCTTVNALETRAPEFKKYLGKSTPVVDRSVPVVQNIVADLAKAGWPKDQKKPAARKAA
jgi:hypothetical protein